MPGSGSLHPDGAYGCGIGSWGGELNDFRARMGRLTTNYLPHPQPAIALRLTPKYFQPVRPSEGFGSVLEIVLLAMGAVGFCGLVAWFAYHRRMTSLRNKLPSEFGPPFPTRGRPSAMRPSIEPPVRRPKPSILV